MTRSERIEQIHQLARDVAEFLEGDWLWYPEANKADGAFYEFAVLTNPDGWQFFMRVGNYGTEKGRILVTCAWPKVGGKRFMPDEKPRIVMDAHKSPPEIAREIERRFMPDALECLEVAWSAHDEAAKRWREQRGVLKRILSFRGTSLIDHASWLIAQVPYGEAKVTERTTLQFELEVPVEIGMNLMRELQAAKDYVNEGYLT